MHDDDPYAYWGPLVGDRRLTQALIADVSETLARHGVPALSGLALVILTEGLHRTLMALPSPE